MSEIIQQLGVNRSLMLDQTDIYLSFEEMYNRRAFEQSDRPGTNLLSTKRIRLARLHKINHNEKDLSLILYYTDVHKKDKTLRIIFKTNNQIISILEELNFKFNFKQHIVKESAYKGVSDNE